ncbi:MAG: caspase family protein, partial [bacterium]
MAKKALLVGINDYKGIRDLRGCINDVFDIHFTLRHLYNFQDEEIRIFTDSRATRENILHRLEWLVEDAKTGDILVFHFSGHGSQIKDIHNDELDDLLDEVICPYDMDWDDKFITDDELDKIFKNVPEGAILEVFLDCCHAGNEMGTKGLALAPDLTEEFPQTCRYLPPPENISPLCNNKVDEQKSKSFLKSFKERNNQNHILWAACAASQAASDTFINGRFHGAFTYFLNAHVRRNPFICR